MNRKAYPALALAALVVLAGCDNDLENLTPPSTTPPTVTEVFEGTLNPNGAVTHTFNASVAGTVATTLTEVLPDATVSVGFILGTWNGFSCATSMSMDAALQGNQIQGNVSGPGALCTRIHDNGKLTAPLTYKITVTHP